MKFKDYVKAGFGVYVGISLAMVANGAFCALLNTLTKEISNESEPEKETETKTEE